MTPDPLPFCDALWTDPELDATTPDDPRLRDLRGQGLTAVQLHTITDVQLATDHLTERNPMTETPTPAVGQIWQDNDPRSDGRRLLIEWIDDTHAKVRQVALTADGHPVPLPGVRQSRIRLDRFRPTSTGYRYIGTA
ncbi:hypothetical protein [Streptomyces sp. LKA04]|uniref:hypothetical protein n=1 Tax=Streptomyces sp. LKA04 TaxID=3398092 RepID=UPI003A7FC68C